MNSINRKVINPTVKKFFSRKDIGHVCFGLLTAGTLGVTMFFARKSVKGRLAEDYNRHKMAGRVSLYQSPTPSAVSKEGQAGTLGVMAGMLYGTLTRSLARGYLKQHQNYALRELLHVQRNFYLPMMFLANIAAATFAIRATVYYYEEYPDGLDHIDNYQRSRGSLSWLW